MLKKVLFLIPIFLFLLNSGVMTQQKSAQPQAQSVDKMLNFAKALVDHYHYSKAREIYIQIMVENPEKKEFCEFMIGKCYALEGGWGCWYAIVELESFINKYPQSQYIEEAKKIVKDMKIYVQWGKDGDGDIPTFSTEEKLAQRYIAYGEDFMARSVRSGEYGIVYNQEELDQAIYWFNKIITEFPNIWYACKAQYKIGEAYLNQARQADYEKAIVQFQKAVDNYPDTLFFRGYRRGAMKQIGDIYRDKIANNKKAVEAYKKLLEMDKDDPNSFYASYARAQINYLSK